MDDAALAVQNTGAAPGSAVAYDDGVLCRINDPAADRVTDPAQASGLQPITAAMPVAADPSADSPGRRLYERLVALAESDVRLREDVARFVAALPSDPLGIVVLAQGIEQGLALGLVDFAIDTVKGMWKALRLVGEVLSAESDPRVWVAALQDLWDGTAGTHVYAELDRDYPQFSAAVRGVGALGAALTEFVRYIGTMAARGDDLQDGLRAAVAVIDKAPWVVAYALVGPTLEAVIAARGNPAGQGVAIGRALGPVVATVALFAVGLFPALECAVVGDAVAVADDALVTLRIAMTVEESSQIATVVESVSPRLSAAATQSAGLYRESVLIYEQLAYRIDTYDRLTVATYRFNTNIRHLYGLSKYDVAYVSMRLDAHHIIEAAWWKRFPEFAKIWASSDDMPCIALHTEWHIRSGARLSANLKLFGAEAEPSLTNAIKEAIRRAQIDSAGLAKPFTTPGQLLDAYEAFYKQTALWDKVAPVFADVRARLAALPPVPRP